MLAHEYNMIDQWVEQVVLIDGTTKTQRNHEINPDFLALLPKYWPRIAAYIDFDTSDLIGDVLYKLGFGGDASFSGAKEKEKACIDFMQRSSTPFLWSNLDRVEALLMVWEDTSSRRRIRGNRVPEELLGLQADSATIAKLAKQGLTQRQIAYQLGVSAATVNRRLRRAPVP
jgi:DNA-binding CsgD family transcriptional regulator